MPPLFVLRASLADGLGFGCLYVVLSLLALSCSDWAEPGFDRLAALRANEQIMLCKM